MKQLVYALPQLTPYQRFEIWLLIEWKTIQRNYSMTLLIAFLLFLVLGDILIG